MSGLEISTINVEGRQLRAGFRRGNRNLPPLLIFNGIGANLELVEPFVEALEGVEVVIFDVPGLGGSPAPLLPYRFSTLAILADKLLRRLATIRRSMCLACHGEERSPSSLPASSRNAVAA